MRLFKKQLNIGQYRLGALWGDYEPRFMDFIDRLCHTVPMLTDDEVDDLILQLQDVVDGFMSSPDCDS